MTGAVPKQHTATRDAVDVSAQIAVGTEDEGLVFREALNDLPRIGRRHHHIGHGLGGSRGVDVRNDLMAGMFLHETGEIVGRTAFGQRAGGVEVRDEHFLVRTRILSVSAMK